MSASRPRSRTSKPASSKNKALTPPTERWLRAYPALRVALREAQTRFSKLPGVCGFGIGRKFMESEDRYTPRHRAHGGLCVTIMVDRKLKSHHIPQRHRIPRTLTARVPGREGATRVKLDVVEVGSPQLQMASSPHVWPTAQRINVGRIFSFGKEEANGPSGSFLPGQAELGTVGAVIKRSNGIYLASSAGHVFIDTCQRIYTAPGGDRRLGVFDKQWTRLAKHSFLPLTLGTDDQITDAMMFAVPDVFLPFSFSWPPGFDRQLATSRDIDAAIHDNEGRGFVWVEREGVPLAQLKVDLMQGIKRLSPQVCNGSRLNYGFMWPYRFRDEPTIAGDSGSPVFLEAQDGNAVRLLGFHFLYDAGKGYAVDAKLFFHSALDADPSDGFDFA